MEPNNQNSQEIDLLSIFKKIKQSFDSLGIKIFQFCQFLFRNIFIILIILALGIGIGYFWQQNSDQIYKHEIVVVPNFGSTTFLYNQVEGFSSKHFENISSIEVEPIVDIYNFSKERYSNLELLKILENQDIKINKYSAESNIEKFYRYHLLTIYSSKTDKNGSIVNQFLNQLNKDSYFNSRQKVEKENISNQINQTILSIEGINKILQTLGSTEETGGNVNISNYTEIHQLINTKRTMMEDLDKLGIQQLESSEVVFKASEITNIRENSINKMIVLPFLFLILYFLIVLILSWFKKYRALYEAKLEQ